MLHIFLDIKKETVSEYNENGYAKYIKVLGFNKSAAPLLKKIADSSSVPLITGKNDYDKYSINHNIILNVDIDWNNIFIDDALITEDYFNIRPLYIKKIGVEND